MSNSTGVTPCGKAIPFVDYTYAEVASHYGFPSNQGTGQTQGILAWGPQGQIGVDISSIAVGPLKDVNYVVKIVGSQTNNQNNLSGEIKLDCTVTGNFIPLATTIYVYLAASGEAHLALKQAIDDGCQVTTCSFAINDEDVKANSNAVADFEAQLKAAKDANMTTCFAAGDSGAASGHFVDAVAYPAGSMHAIAVGGTFVPASTDEETVWWNFPLPNNHGHRSWWASGGGVSKNYPVPGYQSSINPTSFPDGNGKTYEGRGVPDVAVFAQGTEDWVGTSLASPTFAALIACINSELGSDGPVGPIHQHLYNPPSGYTPFTSITTGNNIPPANSGFLTEGYTAQPGWDACTGLGIPDGTQLLDMFQSIQGS